MGVTAALAPRKSFGPFVKRDWTVVAFHSTVEAARRSALLTAIGYEPLAMRTRHGRLQGMLMQPLQLLNHAEVTQHEAAAAIQVPPPPVHLQRPHAPGDQSPTTDATPTSCACPDLSTARLPEPLHYDRYMSTAPLPKPLRRRPI